MNQLINEILNKLAKRLSPFRSESAERVAIYYQDAFHFGYLVMPVGKERADTLLFGPFVAERLCEDELRYIAHKMKIGGDSYLLLRSFSGIVPFFDRSALPSLAGVLLGFFEAETCVPAILVQNQDASPAFDGELHDEKFEMRAFVVENYAREAKLIGAVEHGDVALVRAEMNWDINAFYMLPRYPNDPLREMKNLSITANSILVRAAIRGGLDLTLAHNLSSSFAMRIEHLSDAKSLKELVEEIAVTFASAVHDYSLSGCSELVTNTVVLIRRNLTSPISLTWLAEQLHVSREHLCRYFSREMDMPLTDFIHQTKIRESCSLLVSRKHSIGDIALTFGYSSPSRYTKMFERYIGLPPKRWQQQHRALGL
jgi:AraC-like DNA-binding protein